MCACYTTSIVSLLHKEETETKTDDEETLTHQLPPTIEAMAERRIYHKHKHYNQHVYSRSLMLLPLWSLCRWVDGSQPNHQPNNQPRIKYIKIANKSQHTIETVTFLAQIVKSVIQLAASSSFKRSSPNDHSLPVIMIMLKCFGQEYNG